MLSICESPASLFYISMDKCFVAVLSIQYFHHLLVFHPGDFHPREKYDTTSSTIVLEDVKGSLRIDWSFLGANEIELYSI